jgi:hypothetical protein
VKPVGTQPSCVRRRVFAGTVVVAAAVLGPGWARAAAAAPPPPPSAPAAGGVSVPGAVEGVMGSVTSSGVMGAPAPQSSRPLAASGVTAQGAGPSITVNPDAGLTDGQQVTVTGSGFSSGSAGGMAECNNTPGQPTMTVYGNSVPVGCTNPLSSLQATSASGGFSASFTVHSGTIGPPAQGTDSAGRSAAADAALYPCPPTPAQVAAGNTCGISYGDASGKQASANIAFASQDVAAGSSGATGSSSTSSASGSSVVATRAGGSSPSSSAGSAGSSAGSSTDPGDAGSGSPSTLASTGFGIGLWRLTELGGLSTATGAVLIVVGRRRRRILRPSLVNQQA